MDALGWVLSLSGIALWVVGFPAAYWYNKRRSQKDKAVQKRRHLWEEDGATFRKDDPAAYLALYAYYAHAQTQVLHVWTMCVSAATFALLSVWIGHSITGTDVSLLAMTCMALVMNILLFVTLLRAITMKKKTPPEYIFSGYWKAYQEEDRDKMVKQPPADPTKTSRGLPWKRRKPIR